jgi:hypothetical protein
MKTGCRVKNSFLNVVGAVSILILQGCGGGGGDSGSTTGSAPVDSRLDPAIVGETVEPPASAGAPVSETFATQLGFVHSAGTLISGLDGAAASQWRFGSSKTLAYSPGSVTVAPGPGGRVLLNYDFGCQASTIVVRTRDCRNSVSARRLLPMPVSVNGATVLSVDLRNNNASATFAIMLWDETGQVLRYPVSLRSIENRNPANSQRVYVALDKPSSYWSGANDGRLHGRIMAIAMAAQSYVQDFATGGLNYPAGTLEIGDIRLHNPRDFDYTLQTNAQRANTAYPTYKGRLAISSTSLDPLYLDKAAQAGIYTIRRDMNWEGTERSGARYNFSWYLNAMPEVQNRGMKILWVMDYGHPEHGGATPKTAEDRQAFANWAGAAATAFKGKPVFAYEVWNEPCSEKYWASPDPIAYADLAGRTANAIKAVDSAAKVVTGGVVFNPDPSYLFRLASQTASLNKVDAIGLHPYRYDSFVYSSPAYKRVINSPEEYAAEVSVLKHTMSAAGSTKPLWHTESGYSSWQFIDPNRYGDGLDPRAQSRQGLLTLRKVLTELALDEPLITLYNLFDSGVHATDKELNFGLLRADLSEKPGYTALKHLFNSVGQLSFKGFHTDVPPHTHVMRWESATTAARVFVLWTDNADFSTTVKLPAGARAVKSWTGGAIQPTVNASGESQVTLSEESGPVFVFVN